LLTVEVRHRTEYRYDRAITLEPHRLRLWPREGRDVRTEVHSLEITPPATVTWAQDVFGNTVATAAFAAATRSLTIDSRLRVTLSALPWTAFPVADSAVDYPFTYAVDDRIDLGPLRKRSCVDDDGGIAAWARSFVAGPRTDTLSLLMDLAADVNAFAHHERPEQGTRPPAETLAQRSGSCGDFAVLFVEAVRRLGFGARLVSGYLYQPVQPMGHAERTGSTHAWAEVFVPGAGWICFDPANGTVGGANLVPVAVARDLGQIVPVAGSYAGPIDAFEAMTVEVHVEACSTGVCLNPSAAVDRTLGLRSRQPLGHHQPTSARVTCKPAQAEKPVRTVPQSRSVATMIGRQSRKVA
jgi:transglutaminase-like putative cysteine protease